MKKIKENIKKEITCMELINETFIRNNGTSPLVKLSQETVNKNIFNGLFEEVNLKTLFAQRIYSRN